MIERARAFYKKYDYVIQLMILFLIGSLCGLIIARLQGF